MTSRPAILCLTPIKNEAWILDRFLHCTSLWADYIILADQSSEDGSREIASSYPKVVLIENPSPVFNEPERQKILLQAARNLVPEPRLLITLDADEILTANFATSPEWDTMRHAPPGTLIRFQRLNLLPNLSTYWLERYDYPWGLMDDGSEHVGAQIHSARLPIPAQAPLLSLREIKVMHYQYTDWERMKSKHRWYQCWERLNRPERRAIDIYRQYHHMDTIQARDIHDVPSQWLCGYQQRGIDMTSILKLGGYWWDKELLALFARHGTAIFKREAVWEVAWHEVARSLQLDISPAAVRDPRDRFTRFVHAWLQKTQATSAKFGVRVIESLLGRLGW